MSEEIVARYRAPDKTFDIVVEIVRTEGGEDLVYRRLFDGEVVKEEAITPADAVHVVCHLIAQGWPNE